MHQHFAGQRVLIKFGGNSLAGEGTLERFSIDIAALVTAGIRPVIVHGGGPEISQEMERRGLKVRKVGGLRVTDPAALEVAEEVLGSINAQFVAALSQANVRAFSLPGWKDGAVLARKMAPVKEMNEKGETVVADLGQVGEVCAVDPRPFRDVLASGGVPVIYPICVDDQGTRYNVNADTVAAQVAQAVDARALFMVTDVPGVLRKGPHGLEKIPSLTLGEIDALIADGTITGGMLPKVEACRMAIHHGVDRVYMVDGKEPQVLTRTLLGGERLGTVVTAEQIDMKAVQAKDHMYLFQNYGRQDLCFERGEKEFLYDLEGRRYIDLVAGIAVNALGYAHPAIVRTVCHQAARLMHVSNLYLVKEQADAAESLMSIAPAPLQKVMFCNSGAEANEAALKLAVKSTARGRVVSTVNSFHGRTAVTLSATGQPKYRHGFEPLMSNAFDFIEYGNVEQLKSAITRDTAAFICEPVQGEGGVVPATEEFIQAARDQCDDKGALFIMDEVQTGLGRTGRWFGFQHYGVVPDIVTLAKALGAGFPIGACLSTEEISAAFTPGSHGTTFGGNSLACAVARTVIETIKEDRLVERAASVGGAWMQELRSQTMGTKVTEVRGKGLMLGLEMGENAKVFQQHARDNGILVNVAGGRTLRLVPPLIVGTESIQTFNECLYKFLER